MGIKPPAKVPKKMDRMVLLQVPQEAVKSVPKYGLTLREVAQAYGSPALVAELREIGALRAAGKGPKNLLFDAGDVAETWVRFTRGDFDKQLPSWRSAR